MLDNLSISTITENDIKPLINIIINYKKEHDKTVNCAQEKSIYSQLNELVDSKTSLAYIAKDNNQILGYINGHIIPFPLIMGKECYVSDLLVIKESRGFGIGHKLIKKLEDQSNALGCSRLMLNNPKNSESYKRNFYSNEHFKERLEFANFVKSI